MDENWDDDTPTSVNTAGTCRFITDIVVWEVNNYNSYANVQVGKYIRSPGFIFHKKSCCFIMYPNGEDQSLKEYVSIYLQMIGPNKHDKAVIVFSIGSIFCKQQEMVIFPLDKADVFKSNNTWWYKGVLHKSTLFTITKYKNLKLLCQMIAKETGTHELEMPSIISLKRFISPEALGCFMNEKKFSDVKFIVENKEIFAHKIVLSTQSTVFAAMFEHQMKENQNNIVKIEDISYEVFYELLRFMYSANMQITENIVNDLLMASDKYGLMSLKEICEKIICENLSINNALACLDLADMYRANYLKKEAIDFVASHAEEIINTPDFELLKSFNTNLLKDVFSAITSRMKK